MSLTSLGIASDGMLDRGGNPALHIASMGLLRTGELVRFPSKGGATILVDRFGRPVNLEKVKEAVSEIQAQPNKVAAVNRASKRVIEALEIHAKPKPRDVRKLKASIAHVDVAIAQLERALEAQEDEEIAILLLIS